jgi:predicted ATP-binding protein involved in virulence
MPTYKIKMIEITNLWGYQDFVLNLHEDVNIIIGPNASGKTTILNLLRFILTVDILNLQEIEFQEVRIVLQEFVDGSQKTIKVVSFEKGYEFFISNKKHSIHFRDLSKSVFKDDLYHRRISNINYKRFIQSVIPQDLFKDIENLVPTVWLPVSRRLPISDEQDEMEWRKRSKLESVDKRLQELLNELSKYRLKLDNKLSERYKVFERQVLQMILYSKDHDKYDTVSINSIPSLDEKQQLLRAFEAAGLLDTQMKKRIDAHFSAAEESINRLLNRKSDTERINIDDIFIFPLIGRTKSIIQYARDLEEDREKLFTPLNKFERISQSYLTTKLIKIEDNGNLSIFTKNPDRDINIDHLSSGEKQLLILLLQALLWEDEPVVYIADEPELSLHVTWQEILISSLLELGGQIQIIVATHSPDIVGPFFDKVINLGDINVKFR